MVSLADTIAAHEGKGYVVAPAGFGKTHLIAEALSVSEGRHLVLTHTYAGVNALRAKLRALGVSGTKFRIDTIASWALRLCLSYPKNSGWTNETPEGSQWKDLYSACTGLLECGFAKRIVRASYASVYVDEYQDCSISQHELVLKLAEVLPTRVLGDPLQGIFDFTGEAPVDWDTHITPEFDRLGELDTPWRWNLVGTPGLGDWLREVRRRLETGASIDLDADPPAELRVHICANDEELRNRQINTCKYFALGDGDRVAAIHKGDNQHKAKCHILAKNTGGKFCSIEEIEGKRLLRFARDYDGLLTAQEKLRCCIDFAREKCMSGVSGALSAGTARGEVVTIQANTRNPKLAVAANTFLDFATPARLREFLCLLRDASQTSLYAGDLFNRLLKVLRSAPDEADAVLLDSASQFQRDFRHSGRPVRNRRILGTTLLLKGLEFEHGIVLDAGSLSSRDLYVALTRGSKSLTVISRVDTLNPD